MAHFMMKTVEVQHKYKKRLQRPIVDKTACLIELGASWAQIKLWARMRSNRGFEAFA